MGMGQCRFCHQMISNVDHRGFDGVGTEIIICGAWAHYMQAHNVTLVPDVRQQVMAVNSEIVTGETVAYRGTPPRTGVTLRLFFYEERDGLHVVRGAVDAELFNHIRLLVQRCGGEVPSALSLEGEGAVAGAGAGTPTPFDVLLDRLKMSPQSKTAEWKEWAGVACRKLHTRLISVDLEGLADDPARLSIFQLLVQTAFLEAGFPSEVVRVLGFVASFLSVKKEDVLAEETVGLSNKKQVNLRAIANGPHVDIYFVEWSDYDNLR